MQRSHEHLRRSEAACGVTHAEYTPVQGTPPHHIVSDLQHESSCLAREGKVGLRHHWLWTRRRVMKARGPKKTRETNKKNKDNKNLEIKKIKK